MKNINRQKGSIVGILAIVIFIAASVTAGYQQAITDKAGICTSN
jgi:hypothetical protein